MLFPPVSEKVAVSLQTNVINPAAPVSNVNANVNFGWVAEGCSGIRQYSYRQDAIYTPLFCLKEIGSPLSRRTRVKGEVERSDGDEELTFELLDEIQTQGENSRWHEADVPWNDLDDEGVPEADVVQDNDLDEDDEDD